MNDNLKGKAIILLYHQIGKSPNKQTNLDCFCDQGHFEEQMSFLNDSEYKVIDLNTLVSKIKTPNECFSEDYVVLTFDDGCNKFSKTALPILIKYNFPSTIYPVAGCLGQVASWPQIINPDLKIVSQSELKWLSDQGVDIGVHTMNHVKLSTIDIDKAKEEIVNSKKLLEEIIKKKINSFSYPHGDYNKNIISLVKSIGFSNAVTCNAEIIKAGSNLFELPRKYVTFFDSLESFKKIINYE